jgi:phosphoribosyl-ATP pyrophosphohydrolase
VVTAALGGEGDRRVVEEVADLWFHTMVLLGERSIPLGDVLEELARRHAAAAVPAGEATLPGPAEPAPGG